MEVEVEAPSAPQQPEGGNTIEKLDLQGLRTADYIRAEHLLTVEQKSALAVRLAAALNANDGSPDHSADAEAILRFIIWNAERGVIESMALAAASNPHTPHSLAWALANDDETAAMPILEASAALSDADLVAIVEGTRSFAKMGAIACREAVSEEVARSLALNGDEDTVLLLLNNSKADVSDDALGHMLDRHGQLEPIQECIINRDAISPSITDRLLGLVGTELADKLVLRHQVAVASPVDSGLGRTASPLVGYVDELSAEDLDELISQLIRERSITASFLVRKLSLGNFEFFCTALSAAAKSPRDDVRAGVLESPSTHLPELWEKASLSMGWLPIACAAVSALIYIDGNYSKSDPQIFRKNIVDRTLAILKSENHILTDHQRSLFRTL